MGAKELRHRARLTLRGRWGIAIAVGIVAALLTSSLSINLDFKQQEGETIITSLQKMLQIGFLPFLWSLVVFVIGGAVEYGSAAFHLNLLDGREARFKDLFSQFRRLGDGICMVLLRGLFLALWAMLALVGLVVGLVFAATQIDVEAGVAEILSSMVLYAIPFMGLCLIPAVIAYYRYALMPYLMLEYPDLGALAALRESKYLMGGHKWQMFRLDLSFLGWGLLSALTLGIGFLWLMPYIHTARAAFYRQLLTEWGVQQNGHPLQQPAEHHPYEY